MRRSDLGKKINRKKREGNNLSRTTALMGTDLDSPNRKRKKASPKLSGNAENGGNYENREKWIVHRKNCGT